MDPIVAIAHSLRYCTVLGADMTLLPGSVMRLLLIILFWPFYLLLLPFRLIGFRIDAALKDAMFPSDEIRAAKRIEKALENMQERSTCPMPDQQNSSPGKRTTPGRWRSGPT